ncbi:MAG TPA: GAF domain-containing protein, partial [Blastocatellia bacterium]|nr:GAF domain-containing protein [Blastocatellia bacterium]
KSKQLAQELLSQNERLRSVAAALESENLMLRQQSDLLRQQLEHKREEHSRLEARLSEIETENRRFSERYVEVEQQSANLANLYVASYRLHGTLDRKEVLEIIQEIIINMIGSEELGVFELSGSDLSLVSHFGIEPRQYEQVPLGSGVIGRVAMTGQMYLANGEGRTASGTNEPELTACIPLRVDGKVIGAIAIFRLLEQKHGLDSLDHEMFDLLATHAATALYCTSLRQGNGTYTS